MNKNIILNTLDLTNCPQAIKDLESVGQVIHAEPTLDAVWDALPQATAYLASASLIVDKKFLDAAQKLRVIGSPSTGTDHLDLDAIKSRGVIVYDIAKSMICSLNLRQRLSWPLVFYYQLLEIFRLVVIVC